MYINRYSESIMITTIRVLAFCFFSLSCQAETSQSKHINATTGAVTWETRADGVYFGLTQILPEQARAFYVNRGFSLEQIEAYSRSCVYMTVLRNDNAPGTIHFIRDSWTVLTNGKPHPLVSIDDWVNRLAQQTENRSALIAFRWAQFPPELNYEPGGDWNQGMLSIGLPAGSRFDIIARWNIGDEQYAAKLQGVECAR